MANSYDAPTVRHDDCNCAETDHWHGTRACYTVHRCRCDDCRAANTAYQRHRQQWDREFPYVAPPMVDAGRALMHIRSLMEKGMGKRQIAKVSGVTLSVISDIVYGRADRTATRIRRETEQAILATDLELADGAMVDGTEARSIVDELVARGWTKKAIGQRVHGPQAKALQMTGEKVTVATLKSLRRMLNEPSPNRQRRNRNVQVPAPAGKLACFRCGGPLVGHRIGACRPTRIEEVVG